MVRCHVVRDKIENQTDASLRQFLPSRGKSFRTAQLFVDHVAAHAVSAIPRCPAGRKSGNARLKSSIRPSFRLAIAMPAGLRSQTPISHTASNPCAASASHSAAGTEPKVTELPAFVLSSESQTQVLIS